MENKNQTVIVGVVLLLVGLAIGYGISTAREHRMESVVENRTQPVAEQDHGTMHGAMESMTAGLKGKTGKEFEKAFLDEMIIHHEGAVDMANMVLDVSENEELRNLAFQIIAAQTTEIEQMNFWRKEWFK